MCVGGGGVGVGMVMGVGVGGCGCECKLLNLLTSIYMHVSLRSSKRCRSSSPGLHP